ncbi:MAG: glycosyltransferase family 2 protein [Bacteroidaceae bacterium]
MNCKLAILLATYNGSIYIKEQLDSLFAQSYLDWTLFVQDDLSTDNTLDLVRAYQEQHRNIIILDNNKKLGSMNNFTTLLEKVDAKYYMFCDQDDVWLPNKIELTLCKMEEMERTNREKPIIVHTDLIVVNEKLQLITDSFWHYSRISPQILNNFDYMGAHCLATGCTMMINNRAKSVSLPIPNTAIMHDAWIVVKTFKEKGCVAAIQNKTILYRQHGGNTLGAQDLQTSYIKKRLAQLPAVIHMNKRYYRMLHELNYGSVSKYLWFKLKYYFKYTILNKTKK